MRVYALALLLLSAKANLAAADQAFQVQFEDDDRRGATLLRPQVDDEQVFPIRDTASAHKERVATIRFSTANSLMLVNATINGKQGAFIFDTGAISSLISFELAGIKANAPTMKQGKPSREYAGEASEVFVNIEFANQIIEHLKVFAGNVDGLTQRLGVKCDGLIGQDVLRRFQRVSFDYQAQTLTLIAEARATSSHSSSPNQERQPSSGNLRKLNFTVHDGHYILNDTELERVSENSVEFSTLDQAYTVRVAFLETVLVSKGEPLDSHNKDLLRRWSESIPLVAHILKQQDPIGSLKPLVYILISPKDRDGLQVREQLTLLWSAEPADKMMVGRTGFGPSMHLSEELIDVQYRGLGIPADHLIGKIMLQILYIHDAGQWITLGSFVIASKPNGDYEFYIVPRSVLDQIVIEAPEGMEQ